MSNLPDKSPVIVLNGVKYTVGCAMASLGEEVGIFVWNHDFNLWDCRVPFTITAQEGDMVKWVQEAGNVKQYLDKFVVQVNTWFASQGLVAKFSSSAYPSSEPTADVDVINAINSFCISGVWTGVEIPKALQDAWDEYWRSTTIGSSVELADGVYVSRESTSTASYVDSNTDFYFPLTPKSKLDSVARSCSILAALWKSSYGFQL